MPRSAPKGKLARPPGVERFEAEIQEIAEKVPIEQWIRTVKAALLALPAPPAGETNWSVNRILLLYLDPLLYRKRFPSDLATHVIQHYRTAEPAERSRIYSLFIGFIEDESSLLGSDVGSEEVSSDGGGDDGNDTVLERDPIESFAVCYICHSL